MSNSRPPDISERVVIDLSGRTATYYDPTTYKFDVAIGGMPFIYAITDNTPYRRQTAEFRTQRFDNARDPGEQSLSGSGYWIRSQSSFHLGAGSKYQEPIVGEIAEIRFRYDTSIGIDPWTPGQVKLHKKTSLVEASSDGARVWNTTIGGTEYLIVVNYSATDVKRVIRIKVSDLTQTTIVNNTTLPENIVAAGMGGNDLMLVTPTKVYRYSFDQPSPALHHDYTINTANATSGTINYVKNRFIFGYHDTNSNTFVYELSRNLGSAANLTTLTPVNGSTTLPLSFTFRAVTESTGAIFIGGYSGNQGMIFKITVDNTGALTTMTSVAILPNDEQVTGLLGYLGTFVVIGTSKGARIAVANDTGDLSYGPLVFTVGNGGVYKMVATGTYIYCGVNSAIGGYSGAYRINLAEPLTNGSYAYATDVYAESTGKVDGIAITDDGRVAFTIDAHGLYITSLTEYVESGEFTTGIIRYDTFENKAWKRLKVRIEGTLQGDIDIFRVNNGVDIAFQTIPEGATTEYDYDLASVFSDVATEAQFKFRLNRNNTSAASAAVMYGYSVKALPTPTRARVLQIPIFCFDKETDRNKQMIGFEGYALARLQALEQMEAIGETLIIQDFTAGGEPIEAVVEQVSFTRTTPPNANFSGYGGIIQVIARTVV